MSNDIFDMFDSLFGGGPCITGIEGKPLWEVADDLIKCDDIRQRELKWVKETTGRGNDAVYAGTKPKDMSTLSTRQIKTLLLLASHYLVKPADQPAPPKRVDVTA